MVHYIISKKNFLTIFWGIYHVFQVSLPRLLILMLISLVCFVHFFRGHWLGIYGCHCCEVMSGKWLQQNVFSPIFMIADINLIMLHSMVRATLKQYMTNTTPAWKPIPWCVFALILSPNWINFKKPHEINKIYQNDCFQTVFWQGLPFVFENIFEKWGFIKKLGDLNQTLQFESSAFAFVCFETSTLLKLEISSFRSVENFKLQKGWNQTQKQMIQT